MVKEVVKEDVKEDVIVKELGRTTDAKRRK